MKVFELTEADVKTDFVKFAKRLVQKGQSIKGTTTTTSQSTKTVTKTGGGSTTTKTDAPEYTAAQQNQDEINATNAEIDQEIADAKAAGDTARVAELEKEKASLTGGATTAADTAAEPQTTAPAADTAAEPQTTAPAADPAAGGANKNLSAPGADGLQTLTTKTKLPQGYSIKYDPKKQNYIGIRPDGKSFVRSKKAFRIIGRIKKDAAATQAPKGKSQPIGKVSSARPAGASGVVPSGGGTNALDAIAADRART
jgi:hypothetical protein